MRIYHQFFLILLLFILATASISFADDTNSSSESSSSTTSSSSDSAPSSETNNNGNAVSLENIDSALAASPLASDAIYEFNAGIGFGFEFNDNIDDDPQNPVSAFMTHIRPTLSFKRVGGRIEADINYSGDYTFYLQEKSEPEYQHTIDASITAEVFKNLFFITISESMQQVYDDVTQGSYDENFSEDDARNRNVITIAPYLSLKPSDRTNITLGYTFTDTRYSPNQASETPSFLSIDGEQYDFRYNVSQSHNVYFKVNHELTDRASLYTGGGYTRLVYDDKDSTDLSRYNLYIGGSYAISEELSASLEIGPNYSVPDVGEANLSPYVQASINYAIGRSVFSLSYNTSFEDDPESGTTVNKSSYGINWNKRFERSDLSIGLNYNTYITEITDETITSGNDEQGNTFSPRVNFNYELTDRLTAFFSYYGNIYEDHTLGEHKHTGNYGLRYALSEAGKVSLSHRISYTIPYSEDAYFANQVMLDFSYTF